MYLKDTPARICATLSAVLPYRPNTRALVVVRSSPQFRSDYWLGENGLLQLANRRGLMAVGPCDLRLRFDNGSRAHFVPVTCEQDVMKIAGIEAELICVDGHHPVHSVDHIARSLDRSNFTEEDYVRLTHERLCH